MLAHQVMKVQALRGCIQSEWAKTQTTTETSVKVVQKQLLDSGITQSAPPTSLSSLSNSAPPRNTSLDGRFPLPASEKLFVAPGQGESTVQDLWWKVHNLKVN